MIQAIIDFILSQHKQGVEPKEIAWLLRKVSTKISTKEVRQVIKRYSKPQVKERHPEWDGEIW